MRFTELYFGMKRIIAIILTALVILASAYVVEGQNVAGISGGGDFAPIELP